MILFLVCSCLWFAIACYVVCYVVHDHGMFVILLFCYMVSYMMLFLVVVCCSLLLVCDFVVKFAW